MPRPRRAESAVELSAAIERLREEQRQQVRDERAHRRAQRRVLERRHREALDEEFRALGECVFEFLCGPNAAAVSAAILPFVPDESKYLFRPRTPAVRALYKRVGRGASRADGGPGTAADGRRLRRGAEPLADSASTELPAQAPV